MARRGKIMRVRFRNRRSAPSGLPPELVKLLAVGGKGRVWRRYLPLWGGAIVVGLIVGAGPNLFRTAPGMLAGLMPEMSRQIALGQKPYDRAQNWTLQSNEHADAADGVTATFGFCHTGAGTNCVVDGDTLWLQGNKVRVADIDAPETHDFRCPEEKALGDRATQRLMQLVNSGPVTLQQVERDEDAYGRKLRIVMVNGTSVGDILVREGLARHYEGGRRPWC